MTRDVSDEKAGGRTALADADEGEIDEAAHAGGRLAMFRPNAVTRRSPSSACRTTSRPVPPVAPRIRIRIPIVEVDG
jgi:hypothetical protein